MVGAKLLLSMWERGEFVRIRRIFHDTVIVFEGAGFESRLSKRTVPDYFL